MKPINGKNYGSIPHLSNSRLGPGDYHIDFGQERMLTELKKYKYQKVLVFEKYDGANVGIARIGNNIFALSRKGYEAKTSKYEHIQVFGKWVEERIDIFLGLLKDGERLVGEWMTKPHGIKYKIENDPIVFFDLFDESNNRILYDDFWSRVNFEHNLPVARLLHSGDPVKVEELIPELNKKTKSIESEDYPEGMVYRLEMRGRVLFLAKWVRHDFKPGKYFETI